MATFGTSPNASNAGRQSPKRDLAQAAGRALGEEKGIVAGVAPRRDRLELGSAEEIAGQELEREREVHVHRPLQLGQPADDVLGALEVGVALEALRRDDLAEEAHDPLALHRHLHLVDGGEEEVAAVLARGGAHVVDGPRAVELGRKEAGVGLREDPADLPELGHPLAEEDAALGLGDRLVEAVLGHADGAEARG